MRPRPAQGPRSAPRRQPDRSARQSLQESRLRPRWPGRARRVRPSWPGRTSCLRARRPRLRYRGAECHSRRGGRSWSSSQARSSGPGTDQKEKDSDVLSHRWSTLAACVRHFLSETEHTRVGWDKRRVSPVGASGRVSGKIWSCCTMDSTWRSIRSDPTGYRSALEGRGTSGGQVRTSIGAWKRKPTPRSVAMGRLSPLACSTLRRSRRIWVSSRRWS